MTHIMLHGCVHPWSDSQYGMGMRVFNQTRQNEGRMYRCVVCGGEKGHNLSPDQEKAMKKSGKSKK